MALLKDEQFHVAGLHSEKNQNYRFEVMKAFKEGLVLKNAFSRQHKIILRRSGQCLLSFLFFVFCFLFLQGGWMYWCPQTWLQGA